MNLATWLHQTAKARPDAPAIRCGGDLHATYAEFARRSCAIGRMLAERFGVSFGDRVAIFARNRVEYLEALHGVLWIGAIVVPINHKLHPREAAWIIANAGAKVVFTDTLGALGDHHEPGGSCTEVGFESDEMLDLPLGAAADDTPPRAVEGDDLAWLFYTSGTTGRPKGVMLTHRNLATMALCYALDVDHVRAEDNALYAAPMSHGAGLYNFQFVRAGACHMIPPSQGFDVAEIEALARSSGNLVFFAAPTMVKRLVAHAGVSGWRGEGLRTIVYGGGPMYLADLTEALEAFGPKFVQIYGQGESPMTITVLPRDIVNDALHPDAQSRRMSVGYAQAGIELRLVDTAMNDVPPGEVGEIAVRGDTVMRGYWNNAAATAETIRDGWLRTGDLGRLDADGFLTLTDRSKDVIISGGTNIYPREVEEVLLNHPDIFEVSVIGAPDPDWGEIVVAFVVLNEGRACDAASLNAWCRDHIAGFKKPRRYEFVPDLPKNSYGKVLKTVLREYLS